MHLKSIIIIFLFSLTSTVISQSLILTEDLGNIRTKVPVVEIVDDKYIVLAEKSHLDFLLDKRITHSMLDENVAEKSYYLVYPYELTPDNCIPYDVNIFKKHGRVLATFEKCLLMESTDLKLHQITEYSIKLDLVELEPLKFDINNMAPEALLRQDIQFSPIIDEMLERVNPDSVEALQNTLCNFYTRHGRSKVSEEEVMPWFKEIFKAYGCDSIIVLQLDNCSPMVAGVRYGTKEPSLNKFTLLGGHNDNIISGGSYNQRHEGANDNATGTVAVLEAARVHQHYEFDYTIFYCAFNGEELGLKGSYAIMRALDRANCKAIGGLFSYDMFGMRKGNMSFKPYSGNAGATVFINEMKDIKDVYNLKQPVYIYATDESSPPTDSKNIWRFGYQGIVHNFAYTGSGQIHTPADITNSYYDKDFQAETAKMGIAATAIQAVPSIPVNIEPIKNEFKTTKLNWNQLNNTVVFTIDGNSGKGQIKIFDIQGKLINSINIKKGVSKVSWNKKSFDGTEIASNKILIAKYLTDSRSYSGKLVIK